MVQVVGDVSERKGCRFEWEIPQFSIYKNISIESPAFQFWDATWKLEIYYNNCSGAIFFSLIRDTWKQDWQSVVFQLSARGFGGSHCIIFEGRFEFTEDNNEYKSSLKEENLSIPHVAWNLSVLCVFYKNRVFSNAKTGRLSSKNKHKFTKAKGNSMKKDKKIGDATEKSPKLSDEQKCTEVKDNSMKKDNKIGDATEKSPKLSGVDKLATDLKNLLITEEDSDVSIKVKDRVFKANKSILRVRSSVFYSMFKHDMAEKSSGTVEIVDCDPEVFQKFLLYLYTGRVEDLSNDIVLKLYCVADKYDAEEVREKSVEFMTNNLSVETFCDVISLALKHNESSLLETVTEYFCKHIKDIILTAQWQSFLKENSVAANELHIKALNYYAFSK